jgi:hypothetical protein
METAEDAGISTVLSLAAICHLASSPDTCEAAVGDAGTAELSTTVADETPSDTNFTGVNLVSASETTGIDEAAF